VSMLVSVLLLGESAQAEATKHYGALSVAKWRAVDGATRVTTNASVNQPSQAAADANAIARCVADGGVNCQIVRRFGEGECGWMSLSKRGTAATYGFGPTAKAALSKCENQADRKYTCIAAFGRCNLPQPPIPAGSNENEQLSTAPQ
jgi:Domain of unknown function (DUF4189)